MGHLLCLRLVFERLRKYGVRIKASKCQFFKREVTYFGRSVRSEISKNDLKQIVSITTESDERPSNIIELLSSLGLIGYFRRSITKFNQKAKLLLERLHDRENRNQERYVIDWQEKHQEALDDLLQELTTLQLLAYLNFDPPFILYIHVSSKS